MESYSFAFSINYLSFKIFITSLRSIMRNQWSRNSIFLFRIWQCEQLQKRISSAKDYTSITPTADLIVIILSEVSCTHADWGILVKLVFSSNAKACAVAACSPGEVHCCLQTITHFLVDGTTKLWTIITAESRGNLNQNQTTEVFLISLLKSRLEI